MAFNSMTSNGRDEKEHMVEVTTNMLSAINGKKSKTSVRRLNEHESSLKNKKKGVDHVTLS